MTWKSQSSRDGKKVRVQLSLFYHGPRIPHGPSWGIEGRGREEGESKGDVFSDSTCQQDESQLAQETP